MFEQATLRAPRNVLGDWILRGGIAVAFVLFGAEKILARLGVAVGKVFQQIGAGQWFRSCTGVVEVLGGVLVLIPWTVTAGLTLLACTMASAALILIFVIGRPGDSIVSSVIFMALTAFWWNRLGR